MYLFLFTCIPLALVIHILRRKQSTDAALLWGVFAAALLCLGDYFFIFRDPLAAASFTSHTLAILLFTCIVPQAGLFGTFALICRDTLHYKAGCFFALTASFYAIFVPYYVLHAVLSPGYFELLFVPLIYLGQALMGGLCLKRYTQPGKKRGSLFALPGYLVFVLLSLKF